MSRGFEAPLPLCCSDCAKSLWGEAPCGSAVHGRVDEVSPPPPLPLPNPHPQTPCPQTPRTPPAEDKEDKEESATLPARDFALQLP